MVIANGREDWGCVRQPALRERAGGRAWLPASNLLPPSPLFVSLLAVLFAVFDYSLLTLLLLLFVLSSWMGTPCSWAHQTQALTLARPIRLVCVSVCERETEQHGQRELMPDDVVSSPNFELN